MGTGKKLGQADFGASQYRSNIMHTAVCEQAGTAKELGLKEHVTEKPPEYDTSYSYTASVSRRRTGLSG